jgi:CBS domain-containing protein
MDGPLVRVPSHISIGGAQQIARLKRVNHLLVSEGLRLIGLLSDQDWLKAPEGDPVWKWMRRSIGDVTPDTDAATALTVMQRQGTSFLVVNAGALVLGVVTEGRLRTALRDRDPTPWLAAS